MTEQRITEQKKKKRRAPRLVRRLAAIVTLALAIILADVLSPYLKDWLSLLLPRIDYQRAAVQLTHEMEKAGELVAIRNTDTGMMTGPINAKFLGKVSEVTAPYLYEIGLGVKLADVALTPEENSLTVAVPEAGMLYDSFQVTGNPQTNDFWGFATQRRYQQMQNDQQQACRQGYLEDPVYMEQAWEAVCEQLEALFRQWTGESLRLQFVHAKDTAA